MSLKRSLATTLTLLSLTGLPARAQPAAIAAPPSPTLLASPANPTAPALTRADLETWLDGYMPFALARAEIAGAVVVVVKDGQILLQKGYGFSDMATRTPVDPATTLFRPGSVSKLFVWTAVMQLQEQGKLDLDQDISKYIDFRIPPYHGRGITLRNLMTHTPGFQESVNDLIFSEPAPEPDLGTYLKQNLPPRIFPPGQVPAYSNYGAALAGYIVQRVSGEPIDTYIERHIFAPLGMVHASFHQPLPATLAPLMSKGYEQSNQPAQPFEVVGPFPAGASSISGGDMAHFMIAHLQDGSYQGHQFLRPETGRMMHDTALGNLPPLNSMLLGFYQMNQDGNRILGHGGDTEYFHSELTLLPDAHVGMFVSLNSAGIGGSTLAIREGLRQGFVDRYFPGPRLPAPAPLATAHADGEALAGTYITSRREDRNFLSMLYYLLQSTDVRLDAQNHLVTDSQHDLADQPQKFQEVAPDVWQVVGGKTRLAAKRSAGAISQWGDDNAPFEVFTRVPWFKSPVWLKPALIVSVALTLLTGLAWPLTAFYRRHYRVAFTARGSHAHAYRATRAAALLGGALMVAWPLTVIAMSQTLSFTPALNPLLLLLHLLANIIFPGAFLIFAWNAWLVLRDPARGLFTKAASLTLLACGLVLLWTGIVFHLLGFGLRI